MAAADLPDHELLVLGAGPAGLAAAWRAALRGHSVLVLERASYVGGMAASFDVGGVRVDCGSHRLHPATPAPLLADLRDLLGSDLQLRPRNGRLRVAERWVGFPLRAGELARSLPAGMLAGIAADAATAPMRRVGEPTYASVLCKGLGPTLYDAMYGPYAEKLWGLPGEQISADQARRRVSADTPWKVAARMVRPRGSSGQGQAFWYPRRGFGQLVDSLADAATAAGATIVTGAEVERVDVRADEVAAQVTDGRTVRAARAFSTLPLPVLARIATPGPPLEIVQDAGRLRFRAMLLVYLVVDRRPWTPYDAHYLPGLATPVTRISEPANYRDSPDDPTDRTVICAEIPCAAGDALWAASDGELAELVIGALDRHDLPAVRPVEVVVRRLPYVYPVYSSGYEHNLAGLEGWANALPTVTTFGRLGLFVHDNTHHALTMAYDAVDALRDGGWDADAWAAARNRFSAHVVED